MSNTVNKYVVNNIKQLIDLNGDIKNFILNFEVSCKDNCEFDLLVVDQVTLDTIPNLDYKRVKEGVISGEIIADKDVYQNYFLILKADSPCECVVKVNIKEIPPRIIVQEEETLFTKYRLYIGLALMVLCLLCIFYYLYVSKSTSEPIIKPVDSGKDFGEQNSYINSVMKDLDTYLNKPIINNLDKQYLGGGISTSPAVVSELSSPRSTASLSHILSTDMVPSNDIYDKLASIKI